MQTVRPETTEAIRELATAARVLMATAPAFRLRPVGAPGSEARQQQDNHIAAEDALRAAIKKAETLR